MKSFLFENILSSLRLMLKPKFQGAIHVVDTANFRWIKFKFP